MADTTRPTVTDTNMNDGYFPLAGNVTITFSETIQAGSTPILLMNAGGGIIETIYPSSSRVIISGNVLTVDFATALNPNVAYSVALTNSAIKDAAGNYYAGSTFDFFTNPSTDTGGPVLASASPADNAAGVAVGANIVLTFDEDIQRGTSNIVLKKASGEVVATYASATSTNLSFSGKTLTINPSADLASDQSYIVELQANSVRDLAGNAYAGSTSYNFSTGNTNGPELTNIYPAQTDSFAVDGNIVLTFSEAVSLQGTIFLKNAATGAEVEKFSSVSLLGYVSKSNNFTLSGNVLTLNPAANLESGVAYQLVFDNAVIKDVDGNALSEDFAATFTTAGSVASPSPTPVQLKPLDNVTFSPTDDASGVALDSNIVLTFGENIRPGTGYIVLRTTAGDPVEQYVVASSSNVSISGNTLTINPTSYLASASGYRVELSAAAVTDAQGAAFAGTTAYNFTTAAVRLGSQYADQLTAGTGSETIDGLGGTDTVVYGAARAAHTITRSDSGLSVTESGSTDTLQNIERLAFSDTRVAFDLQEGEAGAMTACFIGALARDALASREVVGIILDYFDDGYTLEGLSAYAIEIGLVRGLAGSDSNEALAQLVFRNVTGKEGSAVEIDSLLAYMDGRTEGYSQAEFIAAVAGHETTLECVGLASLQQSGLEYL